MEINGVEILAIDHFGGRGRVAGGDAHHVDVAVIDVERFDGDGAPVLGHVTSRSIRGRCASR